MNTMKKKEQAEEEKKKTGLIKRRRISSLSLCFDRFCLSSGHLKRQLESVEMTVIIVTRRRRGKSSSRYTYIRATNERTND